MELKSHRQFLALEKTADQWRQRRSDEVVAGRFRCLIEETWGRENLSIEELVEAPSPHSSLGGALEIGKLRLVNHRRAIRRWEERVQQGQDLVVLDLVELHRLLWNGIHRKAGSFRPDLVPQEARAEVGGEGDLLTLLVEQALEWFRSAGFAQIHPVEQTALALTRILDLSPFTAGNDATARIFASHYLLRAGFPPFLIASAKGPEYVSARKEALQFNTQRLVDLLTAAIEESMLFCLGEGAAVEPFPILTDPP